MNWKIIPCKTCGREWKSFSNKECQRCRYSRAKNSKSYQVSYRRKQQEKIASRPCPSRCEACGNRAGKNSLAFDHHHGTGLFRGWLCNPCNTTLGLVGENPAIMDALKAYLENHGRHTTKTLIR